MISAKVYQLRDSYEALSSLYSKPLKALLAFQLKKMMKEVEEQVRSFEEIRQAKAKEIGVLSEDQKSYQFSPENMKLFGEYLEPLIQADVQLSGDQIKIADLSNVELEPKYLASLEWLIVE